MTPQRFNVYRLKSVASIIAVAATLIFNSTMSQAEDKLSSNLSRNSDSGLQIQTELSKDIYRQEPYQDSYTVQVPYQEQETYYEDVPYTERVPYTDYETYYENEYRCHTETRFRDECRDEQLCEPSAPRCHPVTECGTNALGQPICKTREVCESGGTQCRVVRQCRQVPYTDNVCNWEQVAHRREVTRYRDETRYRKELRTRTVTKYREETRCCVTRYREIFDHTETLPVLVRFPAGSELLAGEVESFTVSAQNAEGLDADLRINTSVFIYKVESTSLEGRTKVFVLSASPRLNADQGGPSSISNLKLSFANNSAVVSFTDSIKLPRVQSTRQLSVQDSASGSVVFDQVLSSEQNQIQIAGLSRTGKYLVTLKVLRSGANVQGGKIEFAVNSSYEKKELDSSEVAALADKTQVIPSELLGHGSLAKLRFEDRTFVTEDVQTTYKIVVWKKENGDLTWLGEKNVTRESLQGNLNEVQLKDLGIAASTLDQKLGVGQKVYFDIVVKRSSAKYLAGRPVQFISSKTLDINQ